ncbi:CoA-binding protein [Aliikangiella sp. IMCC44632]
MQPISVVLGASSNSQRFSNQAIRLLLSQGHSVIPVSPKLQHTEGLQCVNSLTQIDQNVDTITMYVNPEIFSGEIEKVINLAPNRVIFNPGTESIQAQQQLESAGIKVVNQCTLIMLNNNTYSVR